MKDGRSELWLRRMTCEKWTCVSACRQSVPLPVNLISKQIHWWGNRLSTALQFNFILVLYSGPWWSGMAPLQQQPTVNQSNSISRQQASINHDGSMDVHWIESNNSNNQPNGAAWRDWAPWSRKQPSVMVKGKRAIRRQQCQRSTKRWSGMEARRHNGAPWSAAQRYN
jgi:hypothetical protein